MTISSRNTPKGRKVNMAKKSYKEQVKELKSLVAFSTERIESLRDDFNTSLSVTSKAVAILGGSPYDGVVALAEKAAKNLQDLQARNNLLLSQIDGLNRTIAEMKQVMTIQTGHYQSTSQFGPARGQVDTQVSTF